MTIIAGLLATDGVVIAADSQATDIEASIKIVYPDKLCKLGNFIVWGLSGGVGLAQHITPAFEAAYTGGWPQKACMDLRNSLGETIATTRRILVEKQLVSNAVPGAEFLVAGFTGANNAKTPWLVEYPNDNMSQQHFKFCAVGSGKKAGFHAFESLRHYSPSDRAIPLAQLFLYRIMSDAIRAESQGVGGDIHLWTITEAGAQQAPQAELGALPTAP